MRWIHVSTSSRRDPRAHLWDALGAAEHVRAFTSGRTFDEYEADDLLRSAVEREVGVVGEALHRMAKIAPELAAQVPDLGDIVGFRDVLLHRYWGLDDSIVWSVAVDELPALRAVLQAMLGELNG